MAAPADRVGYGGALSAGMDVASVDALRPLDGRSRWAVLALVAIGLALLVSAVVDWLEIDLMNRVVAGGQVTIGDLRASDTRQGIATLAYVSGLVVAAAFFIRWFYAAYANLHALGHKDLRFKPGWAIGSWFVPILSLARPKQIANDIWSGSDEAAPSFSAAEWKDVAAPQLLGWWWAAWLGSSFLSNIAARTWFDTKTAEHIRSA